MLDEDILPEEELDEFNNPVFNFNYIYDLGILKELQKWDMNGNFDRVSALLVGMYDKQDVFDKSIKEAAKTTPNDFFNRSFFFFFINYDNSTTTTKTFI